MITTNQIREQLEKQIEVVNRDVDLLMNSWNKKTMSIFELYSLEISDPTFKTGIIQTIKESGVKEVRQFIHNFCTDLCAKKIAMQDLLRTQQ